MEEIIFSIIIPCYNLEGYIHNTINSVLKQIFQNFEIILIDDGSKDNTSKIITEYSKKDSRIKAICKANEGVSKTRNIGVKEARGKYIYFLDGDDTIEEKLLMKAIEVFKNNDIGIWSFGYRKILNKRKEIKYNSEIYNRKIFLSQEFLRFFLNKEIPQCMCSFIIKKELIKNLKFDETLKLGEDLYYQINILLINNIFIYYSSDIFFNYLFRKDSTVNKKVEVSIFDIFDKLNLLNNTMKNKKLELEFNFFKNSMYIYSLKQLGIKGYDNSCEINKKIKKIRNFILENKTISNGKNRKKLLTFMILNRIDYKIVIYIFKILKNLRIL